MLLTLSIVDYEVKGMAVNPKCKHCKHEVDKETGSTKKSNGYYHNQCLEEIELEKEKKKRLKNIVPCTYCSKELDKKASDTMHKGSTKHFHAECFEKFLEEEKAKSVRPCLVCKGDVIPNTDGVVKNWKGFYHLECFEKYKRQQENREVLLNYIAEKYNLQYPTGYMLKQVEDFHVKRGYSYKAMLTTLKYAFEVEKLQPKDNVGVGIITFYYEKARIYYTKLRTVGNSAQNITVNNTIVKVRAVKPKVVNKAGYIDMNSL